MASPTSMDELEVQVQARLRDAIIGTGKHGEDKFDPINNRRLAEASEHEHKIDHRTATTTTTVAAVTVPLTNINYDGEIVEVSIFPITAPSGGDLTYTVDIQKSTGGGAFATVLTAAKTIANGSTNRVTQYATLDSTKVTVERGDALQIVITVAGSTGTQGAGCVVTTRIRENPAA